jgi:LPXTG-motif cell wall-anchored protein
LLPTASSLNGRINVVYLLLAILAVLIVGLLFILRRRRKSRSPAAPRTYGGAIRFTDPSGRHMKIIQKDDGTFETVEE